MTVVANSRSGFQAQDPGREARSVMNAGCTIHGSGDYVSHAMSTRRSYQFSDLSALRFVHRCMYVIQLKARSRVNAARRAGLALSINALESFEEILDFDWRVHGNGSVDRCQ